MVYFFLLETLLLLNSFIIYLFFQDFNENIQLITVPLTHLTFGARFNQPVDNRLPSSLTYLEFGVDFNQLVDCLPTHITHLEFGHNFNKPTNTLPKSVTHLSFEYR